LYYYYQVFDVEDEKGSSEWTKRRSERWPTPTVTGESKRTTSLPFPLSHFSAHGNVGRIKNNDHGSS
jgi:hypothetical protein